MKLKEKLIIGLLVIASLGYVGFVLTNKPTPPTQTQPERSPAPSQSFVETSPDLNELAVLVNKDRTDVGLAPLTRDPDLDASAKAKCDDMVALDYWGHVSPKTGRHGYDIAHEFTGATVVGENLLYGYNTAVKGNIAWMNSAGHKANILKINYLNVGYSICETKSLRNVVVQHFSN